MTECTDTILDWAFQNQSQCGVLFT